MNARKRLWIAVALLVLAAAAALLDPAARLAVEHVFRFSQVFAVRAYIRRLGAWGPVALIGLMLLHGVTFVPAEVLTLAALWVYGPIWGFVYSWVGSMLSAYVAFYVARALGRPLVSRYVAPAQMARLDALIASQGARGLFILRLIPLVSFNALNYAAGLTSLTFWQYTWATALGIMPAAIVLTLLYRSVAGAHSAFVILGVVGLALLVILLLRTWRRSRLTGGGV